MLKPRRLVSGARIAVVAPASPFQRHEFDDGVAEIARLGFEPVWDDTVFERHGYVAGTPDVRAGAIRRALADASVGAVIAVRGGYGSAQLLPLLDVAEVRRSHKPIIGYSDITALLLSVQARTGLVTFHGPIGLGRWDSYSLDYYRRVLFDGEQVTYSNKQGLSDRNALVPIDFRTQTITPGKARGRLVGGNLTVMTAILGSPYVPDWDNTILFTEDTHEDFYRIDRMLTQLRLAGVLGKIKGFVFGTCAECGPGDGNYGALTLEEIFADHVKPLGVPAWQGAMIGHSQPQWTLPEGVQVEIDAGKGTLTLLESPVL